MTYDPIKEMQEIRNQFSYSKRIGFLLGAGTSKSIGLSDLTQLTTKVIGALSPTNKELIDKTNTCLEKPDCNLEEILNHLRLVREITREKKGKVFEGIDGESAKALDIEICHKIYDILLTEESSADLMSPKKFVSWFNWVSRDFTKEIFTMNYDLVLEKSFESIQIPYFDGFVGSNEPFFLPDSVEHDFKQNNLPTHWIRLWKLHGSLGWFWINKDTNSQRIVRLGVHGGPLASANEIVIYPSRDKYIDTRKQPFLSYFDRLRSYLLNGEGLFVISGYSFGDLHVNSIIFDCLKHNNRLHVLGFFHSDRALEYLKRESHLYPNFSAYGSSKAIIKGNLDDWAKSATEDALEPFWVNNKLNLGEFGKLVDFLLICSDKKEKIEKDVATV